MLALAVSPSGDVVAAARADWTVRLFTQGSDGAWAERARVVVDFGREVSLAFSPLGDGLAVAAGATVELWDPGALARSAATLAEDLEKRYGADAKTDGGRP